MNRYIFCILVFAFSTNAYAMELPQEEQGTQNSLMSACKEQDYDTVLSILKDPKNKVTKYDLRDALYLALNDGRQDIVDALLCYQDSYKSDISEGSNQQSSTKQSDADGKLELIPYKDSAEQLKDEKEKAKQQLYAALYKLSDLKDSNIIENKVQYIIESIINYDFLDTVNPGFTLSGISYKEYVTKYCLTDNDIKALNAYLVENNKIDKLDRLTLIKFLNVLNKLDVTLKNSKGESILSIAQKSSSFFLQNLVSHGYESSNPKSLLQKAIGSLTWTKVLLLLIGLYYIDGSTELAKILNIHYGSKLAAEGGLWWKIPYSVFILRPNQLMYKSIPRSGSFCNIV